MGTVLTNRGVEMALNGLNLRLLRSDVGDANVFHLMSKKGVNLGGERSGHFLLSDFATGSDALLNALFFAKIYREKGSLFDYTAGYKNVPCREKSINVTPQQLKSMKTAVILKRWRARCGRFSAESSWCSGQAAPSLRSGFTSKERTRERLRRR